MAYSEKVIDHYSNPKNVGTLDKSKKNVGTGLVGAPECGDVMRLQIEVDDATGVITDAKFKTFGCGSAIASSSSRYLPSSGAQVVNSVRRARRTLSDTFRPLARQPESPRYTRL